MTSPDEQQFNETLNVSKKSYEEFIKAYMDYIKYLKLVKDNFELVDKHSIDALKKMKLAKDILEKSKDEKLKNDQQKKQIINTYVQDVVNLRTKIGLKIQI